MSEFLLMVLENEEAHSAETPRSVAQLIAEQAGFTDALRRGGALKDSGRLRPSREGKRVRRALEHATVEDGPFVEEGRALGGYYWIEASDAVEAARHASACPVLASDVVEVRPIMKGRVDADKDGKPGRLFAFGVLGSAATEEGWVAVMDRIDAETGASFPEHGFLGGVRLLPPTSGQRVATEGGRRALLDGPFLESKEVIGGLFLLRLRSLDEALQWATQTRYAELGTLEIRELWRS